MKKLIKFTFPLLCICLSLTACQNYNNSKNIATSTSTLAVQTNESAPKEKTEQNTEEIAPETAEISETSEKNELPEGVVLSGTDFTVTDEEPDNVTYGDDGVWQTAYFNDFVYASEPGETKLKKYRAGIP